MNAADLQAGLRQCYGTEQWYQHAINPNLTYTDGVKFFAQNAGNGAYWFLDIVATEIYDLSHTNEFTQIVLEVHDDAASIAVDDGDYNPLWSKTIGYTDCPEGTYKFYLIDGVFLLTSEY